MSPAQRFILTAALAAGAFFGVARPAAAQCTGPDGLQGPCWAPVTANLPPLPNAALGALGICWDQCNPNVTNALRVQWNPPIQVSCAQYTTDVTVIDSGSGAAILAGTLYLDYTRTWFETKPAGNLVQVWRFLAKGDLKPVAGAPAICPVPACVPPAGPHPSAFFYGYMDYATECGLPGVIFENVLVLYHACDHFIHNVISDKPGVFHPGRSYGIVAPHTPTQVFVPGNMPAFGGPLIAEAVRNTTVPGALLCEAEDPVNGALNPLGTGCVCTLSFNPPHNTLSRFDGKGTCVNALGLNTSWSAVFIGFPTLPWPFLVSSSIGCWTGALEYPGQECTWVEEGLFFFYDGCKSLDSVDIFYGGRTAQGWPVFPTDPGVTLSQNFLDIGDNWSAIIPGPHPLPFTGKVFPTEHLIYVNVP